MHPSLLSRFIGMPASWFRPSSKGLSSFVQGRLRSYSTTEKIETSPGVRETFNQTSKGNLDVLMALAAIGVFVTGFVYAISATVCYNRIQPLVDKVDSLREEMNSEINVVDYTIDNMKGQMRAKMDANQAATNQRLDLIMKLLRELEEKNNRR